MIPGYVILNVLLIAMMMLARSALLRFLERHDSIQNNDVLNEFKKLARSNMYFALVYLVCGMALIVWAAFLVMQYGLLGILLVLAFSVPGIFLGLGTKKLEERTKKLPCADPALDTEYKRVSEVWVKKALPDF